MLHTLEGEWKADIGDGNIYSIYLPGTLDKSGIGNADVGKNQWHPDAELGNAEEDFAEDGPIATRFTRKCTFEGEAKISRRISYKKPEGKRVFLEVERARCLKLLVDGKEVEHFVPPTISTPQVFEVTEIIDGEHELMFLSDNSYPHLPYGGITYSSAATDETQTNWNGLLGYVRLRVEEPVFIEAVRVYPMKDKLTVKVIICAERPFSGELAIKSEIIGKALNQNKSANTGTVKEDETKQVAEKPEIKEKNITKQVAIQAGRTEITFDSLPMIENVKRWDEFEGNLYELTAALSIGGEKTVTFGVRDFGDNGEGRLALNGRTIFLRGEANCAVFPETGHTPMSVAEWTDVLNCYRDYGINCMRFHSHCPSEAAFIAADKMGMLMQPELSHWNPKDAFESEESYQYYCREMQEILKMLANHPSFIMMTWGNELTASEKGHSRMRELLKLARSYDSTRLYADGSNNHYGAIGCDEDSDFYASQKYYDEQLRGTYDCMKGYINNSYPNAMHHYGEAMNELRKTYGKPVFSFEVGQYEVLPDFDELEDFKGISEPVNLQLIQQRVKEKGLEATWKKYVEATGELAAIAYREEIEAAMRTEQLSGISLLGLQDFPGQGTALVGMMNSHMNPKPFDFAKPEKFKAFFKAQLPLVLLPKYTYENTESVKAEVKIANFGKREVSGLGKYVLSGEAFYIEGFIAAEEVHCPVGKITSIGILELPLDGIKQAAKLNLTVMIGDLKNTYPIWVYPKVLPECPKEIYETVRFDEKAREILEAGGTVYLTPPSTKEALPSSMKAQFTTDFWSVGTFAGQEGGMGQLIDERHPLFQDFPTEFHTNWQWWPMASQRAVILPKQYEAIVTEMDSYAYLRPMAQLLECKCGKGKLLFSTFGLQDLQQYTEARALLHSIYRYLASEEFNPKQEIAPEVMEKLVW